MRVAQENRNTNAAGEQYRKSSRAGKQENCQAGRQANRNTDGAGKQGEWKGRRTGRQTWPENGKTEGAKVKEIKAKAISAELLELNWQNKLEETGKTR